MIPQISFVQGIIFFSPSPDIGLQLKPAMLKLTETDGGNIRRETTEMHLQKQIIKCSGDIGESDSHQSLVKKEKRKIKLLIGPDVD